MLYLIFVLSNYWDIDKWQAEKILQTVAEPLTPYKGVAESSWGPGILSLESLINEVTLNPITRDEAVTPYTVTLQVVYPRGTPLFFIHKID